VNVFEPPIDEGEDCRDVSLEYVSVGDLVEKSSAETPISCAEEILSSGFAALIARVNERRQVPVKV
jgi:hypothetical protein